MSTLTDHARHELRLLGEDPALAACLIATVAAYSSFGHSGGSHECSLELLDRLLRHEALTPLTDDPDEWIDRSKVSGTPMWQNRRHSAAFSNDGGRTYTKLGDTTVYTSEPRVAPPVDAGVEPPAVVVDEPSADDEPQANEDNQWPAAGDEGLLVYRFQLDLRECELPAGESDLLSDFLDRHEVGVPGQPVFADGGLIDVYRQGNGSYDVYIWRAVGGDGETAPACPHCPACVMQERIRIPLRGRVPYLTGCCVRDTYVPIEWPVQS